jgi:hypothetical protein
MIAHVVLFKLKPDTSSEKMKLLEDGLRSLTSIKGVVSIDCGIANDDLYSGYKPRHSDYNYCLIVILKDAKALEFYDKDDHHDYVKKSFIFPIIDTTKADAILALDFDGYTTATTNGKYRDFVFYSGLAILGIGTVSSLLPWIRSRL